MGLIQKLGKITKSVIARYTLAGLIGFGAMSPVVHAQEKTTPTTYEQQIKVDETEQDKNSKDAFVDVKYKTKYVGATGGVCVNNPVIQTTIGTNTDRFSVDVWTNYDTKTKKISEVDIGLNVPFETDKINGNLYVGYFILPNTDIPESLETGVTLAPKNMPLDLSLYAGQIFGEDSGHGQRFKGSVGKTFGLGENTNLSLEGNLTYLNKYFSEKKGFSHATGTASINYNLTKNLKLSSSVSYQEPMGNFRESLENELYGSVGINAKF